MFSIKKNAIEIATMAHYSYHAGVLNIYYDRPDEFNASLDIIIDQTTGKFCSLSYSFHNKSGAPSTIFMTIAKIDDAVTFHLSDNNDKTFATRIIGIDPLASTIAALCLDIFQYRQKSDSVYTMEDLVQQAKQLLQKFNTLGTKSLEAIDNNKILEIFDKIIHILKFEIEVFKNVMEVNDVAPSALQRKF